jgi:hypothetical protein
MIWSRLPCIDRVPTRDPIRTATALYDVPWEGARLRNRVAVAFGWRPEGRCTELNRTSPRHSRAGGGVGGTSAQISRRGTLRDGRSEYERRLSVSLNTAHSLTSSATTRPSQASASDSSRAGVMPKAQILIKSVCSVSFFRPSSIVTFSHGLQSVRRYRWRSARLAYGNGLPPVEGVEIRGHSRGLARGVKRAQSHQAAVHKPIRAVIQPHGHRANRPGTPPPCTAVVASGRAVHQTRKDAFPKQRRRSCALP